MVRISGVPKGLRFAATPDAMPIAEAEALARALARYEPSDDALKLLADRAADARAGQEYLDVFHIDDARTWDPNTLWSRLTSSSPDRLKIPLGRNPTTGKTVFLDLKEAAEGGMGPHGMMTGMTGSGKSETLLQFALSMAMLHSPEMLQLLLGDFKGESAFAPLADLPHANGGVISNMAESAHKLDRFEDALNGEVARRLRVLKLAGGYKDVRDYERARATTRPDLEPLGALVIIIDEFSELLRLRPTIAEVCDTVGRQGRALWIHIINASQRAEVGKMSGLMAQQTFSIGLKVKDAAQSRMAIDSPRAFDDLKGAPQGTGFLVYEGDHFRFRSWLVSAPFIPPKVGGLQRRLTEGQFVDAHRFTGAVQPLPLDIEVIDPLAEDDMAPDDLDDEPTVDAQTVCEVLVERMAAAGRTRAPMHRLWLPPLDDLAEIGVDEMAREFWGRDWLDVRADSGLVVPIGRGDDPFAHTQDLVAVDLSGAGGNLAVAGTAQVGKSTALRTLMMMLAISHSPARVQFYCLDFGGGKLASVAGLPHVSVVAGQGNVEKIGRVLDTIEQLIAQRTRSWDQAGIDLAEFRARKFGGKPGAVPEDGHGDVFLVIDNISVLQSDYEMTNRLAALSQSALNYGMHLVISSGEWLSIKTPIMNKIGTKIELRLANSNESVMGDRKAAATIPTQPGRAMQVGGQHMLIGAPVAGPDRHVVAVEGEGASEQEAVAATAAEIAQAWQSRGVAPAPRMRMLPTEVRFAALGPAPRRTLRLGVGERTLDTVGINLTEGPHFLAVGAAGCGRSTLLKTAITAITETFTPQEAFLIVFDVGMGLIDACDPEYVRVYQSKLSTIGKVTAALVEKLEQRRPPAGLSRDDLARWRFGGERVFVIVDDINLMTPAGVGAQSVLSPLSAVMERGRQIGLHVIATSILGQSWFGLAGSKFVQAMHTGGTGLLVMDGQGEKVGDGFKAAPRAPGRGELAYRRAGHQMIQIALPPEREATAGDAGVRQDW